VIDLKRLRQDPEGSRAGLLRRLDGSVAKAVDALLGLDRERRELLVRLPGRLPPVRLQEPLSQLRDHLSSGGLL